MTLYVDTSALLKRYVEEVDSDVADRLLMSDATLVTSWITVVELRRNLARLVAPSDLPDLRRQCTRDLDEFALVGVDEVVCTGAAEIAEQLQVRSLDAVHLACARRLQIPGLTFLTFDLRQAQAARSLGFVVVGA